MIFYDNPNLTKKIPRQLTNKKIQSNFDNFHIFSNIRINNYFLNFVNYKVNVLFNLS